MATTATGSLITMPAGAGSWTDVRPDIDRFVLACGCGQALDDSRPRHCPRCGVALMALRRAGGAR